MKFKKVQEAAYKGNMGIEELFRFYQEASEKQIKEMEKVLNSGDWEAYKKFIKRVLGINLI